MAQNPFANCTTLDELEIYWDIFASPENISWDGERPQHEIQKALTNLSAHYTKRYMELSGQDF